QMECRERYFMIAVGLSFAGDKPRFEAVSTGVHAITEEYAAECGYTISLLPVLGHVELRASYFSCHTNDTCTLSLPWSPREVTCEVNYMETDERLVFRTPYEQPHSFSTEVNGVPVEVVHAVLFSRQSWVVLVVDLLAACSMNGSYDGGYMIWETSELLHSLVSPLNETEVSIGANGKLVEKKVAEERGYTVEKVNTTLQVSIPYKAEGGYRKSFVSRDLYEYYVFHLYLEQISVDEAEIAARLRFHRILVTPLLRCHIFTENTLVRERAFTIYLGGVPEDVVLVSIQLNGRDFTLPLTNTSTYKVTEVLHPNGTHGYTLTVLFDDPILNVNYTLAVQPGNEPYYHETTVTALTRVPPVFDANCSESSIHFKLDHRPFDYFWELAIGSDVLTSDLADRRGYIMSNDSQSLRLDVPLFTNGFKYQDVTLKGFSGTFEILVRVRETSEVQTSTVKTCLFNPKEFICSTNGKVNVVANLSLPILSGGSPAETSLRDKSCRPKDADGTRALFSFAVNDCGAIIMLGRDSVTYRNEIIFS
uniref:Zona pellucida protein AX 4 n=1 Tax=Pundamilia nyererei TaxID=303518 RepID=A0A3B4H8R1_9CICH